jgi:hypothetical protein
MAEWQDMDEGVRRKARAALKLLRPAPVNEDDCRWHVAAAAERIRVSELERQGASYASTKQGRHDAEQLVSAYRRMALALKGSEPSKHSALWQSLKLSPEAEQELKRAFETADAVARRPAATPKRNAHSKRDAVFFAKMLERKFAPQPLDDEVLAKLAAILFGEPTGDFLRYVKELKKPGLI